jgi:hypothetical protein
MGEKMTNTVFHLGTDNEYTYTLPAREAVLAAYAQYGCGDWQTWLYESRYGYMVKRTQHGWCAGNFACRDRTLLT